MCATAICFFYIILGIFVAYLKTVKTGFPEYAPSEIINKGFTSPN